MPRFALSSLLLVLLTSACSDDLCAAAPRCEDTEAINCEPTCAVGPCSTGPTVQDCGEETTCTVVPGDRNDARFYRSRAVCARELTACNPADAGPPTCEDGRFVIGCSAYRRDIRVPCSQAALYFERAPACCQGTTGDGGTDAGVPDSGTGDGGIPDAGALEVTPDVEHSALGRPLVMGGPASKGLAPYPGGVRRSGAPTGAP